MHGVVVTLEPSIGLKASSSRGFDSPCTCGGGGGGGGGEGGEGGRGGDEGGEGDEGGLRGSDTLAKTVSSGMTRSEEDTGVGEAAEEMATSCPLSICSYGNCACFNKYYVEYISFRNTASLRLNLLSQSITHAPLWVSEMLNSYLYIIN